MTTLLLAIVLTVCAMMFWTTRAEVDKVYDSQLITGANVLRALMSDEVKDRGQDVPPDASLEISDDWLSAEDRKAFDTYADWRMFRVWRDDRLILGSDTGPRLPAPPHDQKGFQTDQAGDKTWRIFTLPVHEAGVIIQVGERISIRTVLVRRILLELAIPLLLILPVIFAVIWVALNDGLRAVRALVSAIGGRGSRDLSPLDTGAWPLDLRPLVESVNDLLARLERSYEHERQFIDSAAHQLRTPLAALSLQAQLISQEDDPIERAAQVRQLREGVARASELTEQLLTLARLGPQVEHELTTDLRAEASAALAEIAVVATAKQVALALEGEAPLVKGDPALVRLILANFVENALTHAPVGSEIQIQLSEDRRFGWVTVSDQGPGIPPSERSRVFQRFFRGANAKGQGSGLGLAIVEEAARVLNARVALDDRADDESGLEASLGLPRTDV